MVKADTHIRFTSRHFASLPFFSPQLIPADEVVIMTVRINRSNYS